MRKKSKGHRQFKSPPNEGSDSSYTVGYGKPPVNSRWAPGKSGNRSGVRKGHLNLETELKNELNRLITIREGDRSRRVRKGVAILKRIVNGALNNDPKATATLVALLRPSLGQQPQGASEAPLTTNDQDLLADFMRRHGDLDDHDNGEVDAGSPESRPKKVG